MDETPNRNSCLRAINNQHPRSERFTFKRYPEIPEWLTDRLLSIDFKISKMETVLFLTALPNDMIMGKYGWMETKGQKATKRNLKAYVLLLVFKSYHGIVPLYISDMTTKYVPTRSLHSSSKRLLIVLR